MPLFNLSALTRHTAYSAAFLLYVAIRKITYLLCIQSSLLIGKCFPYFAWHPSSAANSMAPSWQTRHRYSQQVKATCPHWGPSHSLNSLLKPGPGGKTPERPCSWPFPAQFHKVNETCRGITAGERATRALRASHLESRGSCLSHLHLLHTPSYGAGSVILSPLQRAWKRTVDEMQ